MRVLFSQSERDWPFTIRTSPATGHFGVSEAGTRDVWSIRRDTGTHWRDLQVRTALSRSGAVWRSAVRVGPPDGMARTPGFRFVSFDVASRAVALCAAHIARRRADVRNVTGTPVSCGPRHRLRPAADGCGFCPQQTSPAVGCGHRHVRVSDRRECRVPNPSLMPRFRQSLP